MQIVPGVLRSFLCEKYTPRYSCRSCFLHFTSILHQVIWLAEKALGEAWRHTGMCTYVLQIRCYIDPFLHTRSNVTFQLYPNIVNH